ncbi:MAG: DUF1854 domain-containing protein [Armatimonadetes bacterium]|jgi:hypothetical protein|nr:DUF1854 domain-containing protein [Armatimonadota bacterium]
MPDWTLDYKDQTDDGGELEYLDAATLSFRERGDALMLTVRDDRTYLKVRAVRAFPLSEQHEYIGLLDAINGHEIGMLRRLNDLDGEARLLVQQEIDKRYFVPRIIKIVDAKKEFGSIYWDVETDRGDRRFVLRGLRDSIHEIEPGRYLINDVDGNRFELPQIADLDSKSQTAWDRVV